MFSNRNHQAVYCRTENWCRAFALGLGPVIVCGVLLATASAIVAAAEIQELQTAEIASLISHFGGIIDHPADPALVDDPRRFREAADRLVTDGVTPEIRQAATQCVKLHETYEARLAKWIEMTRNYPDPSPTPGDILMNVLRKSAAGAYRMEVDVVTEHRLRSGLAWQDVRSEIQDKSNILAPLDFGMQWLVAQHVSKQHAAAVLKLKQDAARELLRLDTQFEEQRHAGADLLLKFVPPNQAGQRIAEPILEIRTGEIVEPLDISWRKRRQSELTNPPPVDPAEREVWESEQRLRVSGRSLGFLNRGSDLSRVVLLVEYSHCLHPREPVVRHVYYIPEWKRDNGFVVLDAFRPNLPAGQKPALKGQLLEMVGEFGEPLFPGFSGVIGVRYSLWSAEHWQEGIELSLDRQRTAISNEWLSHCESLATIATREDAAIAANNKQKPGGKKAAAALEKKQLNQARQYAREALALAGPDWPQRDRAKALASDPRAVETENQSGPWAATRPGTVFELTTSSVIGTAVPAGEYRLEFTGFDKQTKSILGKLTIVANAPQQSTTRTFKGELRQIPGETNYHLQLVLDADAPDQAPDKDKPGQSGKAAPSKKKSKSKKKPGGQTENEPSTNQPLGAGAANGSEQLPRQWLLTWNNETWNCPVLTVPFQRKSGQANGASPTFEDPDLPIGSIWTGVRQHLHLDGRVLKEERFSIQIKKAEIQPDDHPVVALACDITWEDGVTNYSARVSRRRSVVTRQSLVEFSGGYVLGGGGKGRPAPVARESLQGGLREGTVEGLVEKPNGHPDEAIYTMIKMQSP